MLQAVLAAASSFGMPSHGRKLHACKAFLPNTHFSRKSLAPMSGRSAEPVFRSSRRRKSLPLACAPQFKPVAGNSSVGLQRAELAHKMSPHSLHFQIWLALVRVVSTEPHEFIRTESEGQQTSYVRTAFSSYRCQKIAKDGKFHQNTPDHLRNTCAFPKRCNGRAGDQRMRRSPRHQHASQNLTQ
jgi:hypothetical protein